MMYEIYLFAYNQNKEEIIMTEDLLRRILKEANEKEQYGLFFWPDWRTWDCFGFDIKQEGEEQYEFALSQILKGEEATITVECIGLSMTAVLAISVKKLECSKKFFEYVLEILQRRCYEGPVTLLPSNK